MKKFKLFLIVLILFQMAGSLLLPRQVVAQTRMERDSLFLQPDSRKFFNQPNGENRFQLPRNIFTQTSPGLDVEAADPVDETTPGRSPSPLSVIMWLVTVAVAILILVGLYYWWFQVDLRDKRERFVQGAGIMNPEKQVVYCHECGKRSRIGDSYCSNCGTELRKPTRFEFPHHGVNYN